MIGYEARVLYHTCFFISKLIIGIKVIWSQWLSDHDWSSHKMKNIICASCVADRLLYSIVFIIPNPVFIDYFLYPRRVPGFCPSLLVEIPKYPWLVSCLKVVVFTNAQVPNHAHSNKFSGTQVCSPHQHPPRSLSQVSISAEPPPHVSGMSPLRVNTFLSLILTPGNLQ